MRFRDRVEAGRELAELLRGERLGRSIVLGLPRGGVPVAAEVARALGAPLDAWVARKIGAPLQPELGIGAVAEGGAVWLNRELIEEIGLDQFEIDALIRAQEAELERRVALFRGGRPPPALAGRTVIVVDDGIATGATIRAAVSAIHPRAPRSVIVAAPVASEPTVDELRALVDDIVCTEVPFEANSIGQWYQDFTQVSDQEVIALLARYGRRRAGVRSS
jgi:putative phosphoribosyl transferase